METIQELIYTYPQLTLGVAPGRSETVEYGNIVKRGKLPENLSLPIAISGEETLEQLKTPAGTVHAVYLPDRKVFEYFVQVMAYRCEPAELPPSMGAVCIRGLNNWRKIQAHKEAYCRAGHKDWKEEFRRFTAVKENYRDTILLISRGGYSGLRAEDLRAGAMNAEASATETGSLTESVAGTAGLSEEEWVEKSRILRTWHELSHVVSGKRFPENKEALRDEVVADGIGIVAAFGHYDIGIARLSLGIEGNTYRKGGRLENYVEAADLEKAMKRALELTGLLEAFFRQNAGLEPFEALLMLEKEKTGIPLTAEEIENGGTKI